MGTSTFTHEPVWRPGEAHPARRKILAVLCLALLIVVVDNTVLNTALPTLARRLHAGRAACSGSAARSAWSSPAC